MPLYHPAELPVEAITKLVKNVRSGDYTSPETIDAAFQAGGCVNALRGPQPFGFSAHDTVGEIEDKQLCAAVEHHLNEAESAGFGAEGDETEAIPPVLAVFLFELVSRVLTRFLKL